MRYLHFFFIVALVFIFACSQGNREPETKTGTLKSPVVTMNPNSGSKFGGTSANKTLEVTLNLPLVLIPSFEYRMITRGGGFAAPGRDEFCVLQESESSELNLGARVEVLEEARCLYVRLNSNDGIPRPYTTTIVRIRLLETGQEGWTWYKAIEFD